MSLIKSLKSKKIFKRKKTLKQTKNKSKCKNMKGGEYRTDIDKDTGLYQFHFFINNKEDGNIKYKFIDVDSIYIAWVFIRPFREINGEIITYSGKGYGTLMLKEFEEFVKQKYPEIKYIKLTVKGYSGNKNNKIKNHNGRAKCGLCIFYEKSGYEESIDNSSEYIKKIQ